ncbi:MAG: SpoVR family protein [Thiolinea sp.]
MSSRIILAWSVRGTGLRNCHQLQPRIAYLMEENTPTMQALVIAHACYGHNSFFKGNYLFRSWTDAEAIIDYLVFARNYIAECEERHGTEAVESLLDSCHALMNYGVDRYQRPTPVSAETEKQRQKEREEYIQQHINDLWRTLPRQQDRGEADAIDRRKFPKDPQENILYFVEKIRRPSATGSVKSCVSCAKSPSIFIRSARPR